MRTVSFKFVHYQRYLLCVRLLFRWIVYFFLIWKYLLFFWFYTFFSSAKTEIVLSANTSYIHIRVACYGAIQKIYLLLR